MKGVRNTVAVLQNINLDRWLKATAQGDRAAFEQLYYAASPAVYAYALSILKDPYDAEDVLQECFVTVWNRAGQYRSQDKPMAWLLTVARNLSYRIRRSRQRLVPLDAEDHAVWHAMNPEDRHLLQSCLRLLTEEERQIVVLHAVAGCTHQETARHLNLKLGTVLSKYHRAIQKLRASM